jgi:hypothetical protein
MKRLTVEEYLNFLKDNAPYVVRDLCDDWDGREKLIEKCIEMFGAEMFKSGSSGMLYIGGSWDYRNYDFYFVNENDAVMFKMRFG